MNIIFSWSFFLSSSSGTPMIRMLGHLTLSCRSLRLSSFLLIRFSFFLSDSFISTILSSTTLILSSAFILLLAPSGVFLISFIALFIICVLVAQLCPTLCDPMDCNPPGSSVHEIFQARILEWVAVSFSRGSSRPRDRTQVSHIAGRRFNLCTTRE